MANHILAGAVDALAFIANVKYPDEQFAGEDRIPGEAQAEFTKRLRAITEQYWPELWQGDERRALDILRDIRQYLTRFWRETDEHARDWYIHRAREYHQHQLLHPVTWEAGSRKIGAESVEEFLALPDLPPQLRREIASRKKEIADTLDEGTSYVLLVSGKQITISPPKSALLRGEYKRALENLAAATTADEARNAASWVNIRAKMALDEPPQRTIFEQALFELQRRTRWASLAPAICKNEACKRYFLPDKKGRRFCLQKCAHESLLENKREHWKENKGRYNKKRRAQ